MIESDSNEGDGEMCNGENAIHKASFGKTGPYSEVRRTEMFKSAWRLTRMQQYL